jgi:hypothetical protein
LEAIPKKLQIDFFGSEGRIVPDFVELLILAGKRKDPQIHNNTSYKRLQ